MHYSLGVHCFHFGGFILTGFTSVSISVSVPILSHWIHVLSSIQCICFLFWIGIVAARKVYESLSIRPPLCLELHTKMAALESVQPDISLKHVRRCYEMACNQFGSNNSGKLYI